MDDNLKEQYEFLEETYIISKATFILAEKIYHDYDETDNRTRDMSIIFINALFHSAAVNICRILDHDANGINIHKFLTTYCAVYNTTINVTVDCAAVERLRKRRNKALVHADKKLLNPDFSKDVPLYISDLDSILKSLEKLLLSVAKKVTGTSIDLNKNTRQIEIQYDSFADMLTKYAQMGEFMKQNHSNELLAILYSTKEDANNGQA